MKHDPVIDDIRAAFPAVPIVAANAFQQRGSGYCDTHEYRAALDGKTWEQLDPLVIARRADALWFLGDDYVRAVLPMYLKLLLVFSPMSPVAETLLFLLTRPEPSDRNLTLFELKSARFAGFASGLSPAQAHVIAVVLRRFIELYPDFGEPAQRALDRYWAPRADDDVKSRIIDDIRAAFPAVPIAAANAFQQRGWGYCDTEEYRAALDGKTWEQLDPLVIARRADSLLLLSDDHLRAVLPMYLKLLLVFWPRSAMVPTLLFLLTRPEPSDPNLTFFDLELARFAGFASGLSPAQAHVIAVVLRRFIELHPNFGEPAQRALDRYWAARADGDVTPSP